jgi:hypothetical protein
MLDTLAQHVAGKSAAAVETQRRATLLTPAGAELEIDERLAQH